MLRSWFRFPTRVDRARHELRATDAVLLLEMIAFASIVPLVMRLKPSYLQRILAPGPVTAPAPADTAEAILRHFTLARRVARPLVGAGCLTRGVTLCYFLRRAGVDVSLNFGMGKVEGQFLGHCWLTRMGTPFLERRDPRDLYALVFSVPRDAAQS